MRSKHMSSVEIFECSCDCTAPPPQSKIRIPSLMEQWLESGRYDSDALGQSRLCYEKALYTAFVLMLTNIMLLKVYLDICIDP